MNLLSGIASEDSGLWMEGLTSLISDLSRAANFFFSKYSSLSFFHFLFSCLNCSLTAALLFFWKRSNDGLVFFFIQVHLLFYNRGGKDTKRKPPAVAKDFIKHACMSKFK